MIPKDIKRSSTPTNAAEHYEGYGWIKVKREKAVEIDGVKYVTEEHHIKESSFLIDEIRKLAKRIDAIDERMGQLEIDLERESQHLNDMYNQM